MTREHKLEVALREARNWIDLMITNILRQNPQKYEILSKIDDALATPPTSEWNEAIEEAARTGTLYPSQRAAIRALKRKEQP